MWIAVLVLFDFEGPVLELELEGNELINAQIFAQIRDDVFEFFLLQGEDAGLFFIAQIGLFDGHACEGEGSIDHVVYKATAAIDEG